MSFESLDKMANMSDEELEGFVLPSDPVEPEPVTEEEPVQTSEAEPVVESTEAPQDGVPSAQADNAEDGPGVPDDVFESDGPDGQQINTQSGTQTGTQNEQEGEPNDDSTASDVEEKGAVSTEDSVGEDGENASAPQGEISQEDAVAYKAFYEQILAPFKANGTMIQLNSAGEVISLMQMGANYTKRMQELHHQKKYIMMLDKNGLLDEERLNFLIDLDKKNPAAIKQLLKEAEIDPLDLDISDDDDTEEYRAKSHAVSDQEVAFSAAVEEVRAMDDGPATLQSLANWDSISKNELWKNPNIIGEIHQHRLLGAYDTIMAEVNRRKLVGLLPHNTPVIQAYNLVGNELAAQGVFQPNGQPPRQDPYPVGTVAPVSAPNTAAPAPVAVRTARTPKPQADNRAKAAAPTRTSPKTVSAIPNYGAMSDEEFMKMPPP